MKGSMLEKEKNRRQHNSRCKKFLDNKRNR